MPGRELAWTEFPFFRILHANVGRFSRGLVDEIITLHLSGMMRCRCKEAGRSHQVLKHVLTPFIHNRT